MENWDNKDPLPKEIGQRENMDQIVENRLKSVNRCCEWR